MKSEGISPGEKKKIGKYSHHEQENFCLSNFAKKRKKKNPTATKSVK